MPNKARTRKQTEQQFTVDAHESMLRDRLRTNSYRKAIDNCVRSSDVVVDIGCGTGILSFFAAQKGCRKVYAVDSSDLIACAAETAGRNNLGTNITFIRQDISRFRPKEKIDLLIHEQIGSYIWDEDLIAKVAYIRDNFLKKNGRILPARIDLYLVPSSYSSPLARSADFWAGKPYGIDFSCFREKLLAQQAESLLWPVWVHLHDRETFLGREKLVHTVDLRKDTEVVHSIATEFRLKKGSVLTGICGYFTVHLDEKTSFSTKPRKTNTHWGQFFLPRGGAKRLRRDAVLRFTLSPSADSKAWKMKFDLREEFPSP